MSPSQDGAFHFTAEEVSTELTRPGNAVAEPEAGSGSRPSGSGAHVLIHVHIIYWPSKDTFFSPRTTAKELRSP